jgi:hypothetical protein
MFELSRLKKRARAIVISAAASGMVIGNVASVAALNTSSMTLSDSRPLQAGVTYTFDSDGWDTVTAINCVQIVFSVNADGTGGVPAGMITTGADFLASSTALTHGSWTETFTANGTLELTSGGEAILATPSDLVFNGITNPNTDDTFFATVDTYTNADCSTGPTDNVVVAFATKDGTPVSLTVDPSLTFTCTGVASGTVNGETITHSSTGTTIDYLNDVTAAQEGVSAHDLAVTTNASGGWTVYIQHTGQLTNGASDTIDNHTGTNLSPTTMSNGTEGWGYTTEDTTLSAIGDGAGRFGANEFAGFTTSGEEVITDESGNTRVGHRADIAGTTEAGTYTTTIVYTVVATF